MKSPLACALLGLLCLLTCMTSCSSCERQAFIAELIEQHDSVQRDDAKAQNQWRDAQGGERFVLGDGLRTGKTGQATLKLPQDGRLLVKSGTVVRFLQSVDKEEAAPEFDVQQGELTVESGARRLGVRTARGLVTVNKDSTVRIRAEEDTTRFDVEVGRVEYMLNGAKQVAEAGGSFEVDVLQVSVEAEAAKNQAANKQNAPLTAVADASSPDAKARAEAAANVFQESPTSAFFKVPAGETATIHDPVPPTDIAMTFDGCDEQVTLELDHPGQSRVLRFRGQAEVRASLPRGSYRYRVRCLQEGKPPGPVVRSGQLKVLADAATRPLPQTPVTITADADGRRYTVSYQNLLPIITLRWPYAPRASSYHLTVQPAQGAQFSEDSAQSSITMQPGRLAEGVHRFWFETPDHKRSEIGSLQVSFDYAARTAYLTSPRDGEALQADSVRFSGGTLLGSLVHVQGAPMKMDSHGRFSTNVTIAQEQSGAVVRVQHPSTAIHYNVRHLTR
jgi:hypothetical protein